MQYNQGQEKLKMTKSFIAKSIITFLITKSGRVMVFIPALTFYKTENMGILIQKSVAVKKRFYLPIIALDFGITVSFLLRIPAFPFETISQSIHTDCMLQMLSHKLRLSVNLVLIP